LRRLADHALDGRDLQLRAGARDAGGQLVPLVALLAPGVAAVVVAQRLPEAWLVVLVEADAADPLGALPEVEVRDEQPRGGALRGRQRLAVVLVDHPGLPAGEVRERQVRRVAAVAV